ncbi:hypothetical protein BDR04DRAFT_1112819 [Suillus decipiens]|nr:hypothetical protein BDR04DRAFT_1112819 [Suillus decipiens]
MSLSLEMSESSNRSNVNGPRSQRSLCVCPSTSLNRGSSLRATLCTIDDDKLPTQNLFLKLTFTNTKNCGPCCMPCTRPQSACQMSFQSLQILAHSLDYFHFYKDLSQVYVSFSSAVRVKPSQAKASTHMFAHSGGPTCRSSTVSRHNYSAYSVLHHPWFYHLVHGLSIPFFNVSCSAHSHTASLTKGSINHSHVVGPMSMGAGAGYYVSFPFATY